ncbi:hypothetical protein BGZ46_009214 [Entomortierella lignicola]|nr:hypothetical protein BGZ46_009214 [Entomortierella lignicola]
MDPYRQQYPPYQGQPPQQQQQQGAPPHLRHGPPPGHYGPPPTHLQGRPPHMYPGAPPPHLQQPYPPHMQGPPPHQQQPPHFQARGPMPGVAPPGQHYPPGSGAGGPYGAVPALSGPPPQGGVYPPQHQRLQRPPYGPGPIPPPAGAGVPPGSGPMNLGGPPGFNSPPPAFNKPASVTPGNAVPASAFVVGGALPDKMNTLFIGSIAPGINNVAMEQLLKTTGNLVKWKRVQDPTSHQWKAFGFAEYADADSLLRTLRVLGQDGQQPKGEKPVGLELTAMDGSGIVKALLVKADEKTRQFLDQYEESRPRTIHDTEKDKVALGNANKIIQKIKDGTLDTSEPEQRSDDKEDNGTSEDTTSKKADDQESEDVEVSEEQKELIARELNFFRERAALKEKARKEEEEKAERHRLKQQRDRETSAQPRTSGRERAWGSNSTTLGTRATEFVPASHPEAGAKTGSPSVASTEGAATVTAVQDPGVDSEEEEKARLERREREQEHVYRDRERRWEQREVERLRQYEKDKLRDEEYILENQSSRATMAHRFAQWDDDVERERRHEEYYRDRSRWWQRRQAFLQKEERYDALDREEEKEELEQEAAKKAQEEASVAAAKAEAAAASSVDHDGDSEMKDVSASISTTASAGDTLPGTPNSSSTVDASVLPNQPTKLKLSLATSIGGLKRGSSESSSGVGTPTSGFVAATEFEHDDDDKEVKKRRVLMPFKYGDDDTESESKKSNGSVNGGPELSAEEKEKMEKEMKALIQLIPADAQGLWNWEIQWQYVFEDNSLILNEKIRPFASKKVVELLGVQEDELTNFVIEHIRQKKPPQELVDELRNALDSDADVLVMKIWRMLIFETEFKARKLSSSSSSK